MVGDISKRDEDLILDKQDNVIIRQDRSPLLPNRHPTDDLFVCDFLDAVPKGDLASMEHPFFTLSTKPDRQPRRYEHGDIYLEVKPSSDGLATVYDRDILIYCISQIMAAINSGRKIDSRTLNINPYELLTKTNRMTNGQGYAGLVAALDRLSGTRIVTNIKIGGKITREGFGLIDKYKISRDEKTERMLELHIQLGDWVIDAIKASEVLTLHRDYFRLRKPLERRMYDLARKHCGYQSSWRISLQRLQEKTGSISSKKEFKRLVLAIIEQDKKYLHFPDYMLSVEGDYVIFSNRHGAQIEESSSPLLPRDLVFRQPDTLEKAKRAAPGYDIYALEADWRDWLSRSNRAAPKNPDAAFIGFCRSRHKRTPLA